MAYFAVISGRGTWILFKVASYIDPPGSRWVNFSLKDYRKVHRFKTLYMLSWHMDERRIAESSEWRDLMERNTNLAEWCKAEIEKHMTDEEF